MRGVKRLVDTKHFLLGVGYRFDGFLTAFQFQINKREICLRLDIFFFGLYVGWLL